MPNKISTVARTILHQFIAAIKPAKHLDVDAWSESNIVLSSRNSPIEGPLRFNHTPYLRFIVNRFTHALIRRIKLCFGTQVGKTTAVFCMMGYAIDRAPGPMMYMGPIQHFCKEISKDRLQTMINDCPALRRHKTGRDDDFQLLQYTLDRMTVHFAWSYSDTAMRSHPIKYLFKDEKSAFKAGASGEADDRTKAYWNHKIVETSTPMTETDPHWGSIGLKRKDEFKDSRGEEMWNISAWEPDSTTTVWIHKLPCPHCDKYISLEWQYFQWDKSCAIRDLDDRGWYECQECGKKITDTDKLQMLDRAAAACAEMAANRLNPLGARLDQLDQASMLAVRLGFDADTLAGKGERDKQSAAIGNAVAPGTKPFDGYFTHGLRQSGIPRCRLCPELGRPFHASRTSRVSRR